MSQFSNTDLTTFTQTFHYFQNTTAIADYPIALKVFYELILY